MNSRTILGFFLLLLILFSSGPAAAAPRHFAVAPFRVHGPEQYQYLRQGVQNIFSSRLTRAEKLQPSDKSLPSEAEAKEISRSRALEIIRDLELDYLVYGSVTLLEEQSNVSVKALSRDNELITQNAQAQVDELIPRLKEVAGKLRERLLAKAPIESKVEPDTQQASQLKEPTPTPQEKSANRSELNPSFKSTRAEDRDAEQERWISRSLPFVSHGMRVGDADLDGRNEAFLLQDHSIRAFVVEQGELRQVAEYETSPLIQTLRLSLITLEDNEPPVLVVSALRNKKPASLILEFRNGEFLVKERSINFFLNAVRMPPDYSKQLVGQKRGSTGVFARGVHNVDHTDGNSSLGRRLDLPRRANVFNFAYLPRQEEGPMLVIADTSDNLRVYSSSKEQKASTDARYAGSGIKIPKKTSLPGMEDNPSDPQSFYYVPTRLIPCNLTRDQEFELLTNRISSTGFRLLSRHRSFSKGQIHSLYWDGQGLNTAWKTEPIEKTVQDYGLGDLDNDGGLELYVCLTTAPGFMSGEETKTIVLAYPLEVEEDQAVFRPR